MVIFFNSKSLKGFTLLEILIVIVIIGVILTFVTLSVGDAGQARLMRQEAQRLASLLELASQEAITQIKEMGVAFERDRYQFYWLQDEKWQKITQDRLFRTRHLPAMIELKLQLNGTLVDFSTTAEIPQILLLSSGEVTPFTVEFYSETERNLVYRVIANINGVVKIQHDTTL